MSCGERGNAANINCLFDGSDAHLLPRNIADCAAKLRQYNRWRRGEDWSPEEDGPNPKELGLLIDYAAAVLDEVREFERQRDELLEDIKESEAVRDRLATLLSETAIALKGEEESLQRHSWHDLPVGALAAMLEITILKQQRDELLAALEHVVSAWSQQFERYGHMAPAWAKHAREAITSIKGSTP